ncbi:MAG: hypothetical protein ACJ71Z_03940 [Aeromicrobium sp.]
MANAEQTVDVVGRLATFPSEQIRPIPSFVFAVPRGWVIDDAPDALTVIRTPEELDGFWPNLVLSHDKVARTTDLEQAAKVTWAKIKSQCPDAEIDMQKLVKFNDLPMYLRGCTMSAPQSGRKLAQLHALFLAPVKGKGRTMDLFQFTATCPEDHTERAAPIFLDAISSFRFT